MQDNCSLNFAFKDNYMLNLNINLHVNRSISILTDNWQTAIWDVDTVLKPTSTTYLKLNNTKNEVLGNNFILSYHGKDI